MTDEQSVRLALPLLYQGQAQKEWTHNEALARLDLLVQAAVEAVGRDDPPAEPEPGQCWIVGPAPEGAWTGQANALAGWTEAGWRFAAPFQGMAVWDRARAIGWRYRDGGWRGGELRGSAVYVDGTRVLGPRAAAIATPDGGGTVDAEARTALDRVLQTLVQHGLIEG